MKQKHLSEAVTMVGGQTALAEKLGVKQAYVWKWLNTTKDGIPAEYVRPTAEATNWVKTPNQLRPDLYQHPHDGLPEHLRVAA